MKRGEIWWAELPEPWGTRPVVLLARDDAYSVLRWVIAAPTTTRIRLIPSMVTLDPDVDPVPKPCAISLDHLQAIEQTWLVDRIGQLSDARLVEVNRPLHFALGLRD